MIWTGPVPKMRKIIKRRRFHPGAPALGHVRKGQWRDIPWAYCPVPALPRLEPLKPVQEVRARAYTGVPLTRAREWRGPDRR